MVDSLAKGLKIVPDPSYLNMHGNRTFNLDGEMMRYATLEAQDKRFIILISSRCHPLTKAPYPATNPSTWFRLRPPSS
jgi:hypothetical protein